MTFRFCPRLVLSCLEIPFVIWIDHPDGGFQPEYTQINVEMPFPGSLRTIGLFECVYFESDPLMLSPGCWATSGSCVLRHWASVGLAQH